MDAEDDKLDALMERAAPDAPPGFADRVMALSLARRRRRRIQRVLVAAVAVVAVCLGLWAILSRRGDDDGLGRVRVPRIDETREPEIAVVAKQESYAVQLLPKDGPGQRVMMAHINGTYIIRARPKPSSADEAAPPPRTPSVKAGMLSTSTSGESMAASLK
ncbi:hypothetical protein ACFL09_01115 [Planctomycetota bacterium]